ncbi:MAG: acyltransferase [Chloroflexota bacterium]
MSPSKVTTPRRFELDWLRVLAILTVFVYHSTRFFNLEDWHVKNPTTYPIVEVWNMFSTNWMMPVIFFISGASLFYALSKGGVWQFFKDKTLRLLVPLLVGVFTHATLQVYLERLTHGQFSGSYFQFLPHYFDGVYMDVGEGGNFAWMGLHLWYLVVLFLFCIFFYPLLRWLKGSGQGVLRGLGSFLALPGAAYLLALPLIWSLSSGFMDDPRPGGWSLPSYACFFLGGFIVVSHARLQENIRRMRWLSLAMGMTLMVIYLGVRIQIEWPTPGTLLYSLFYSLIALCAWSWVLAILGFGMQHLNFTSPFLKYANEAVLPFYILHQTVLLCVGYFVVQWAIPDPLKWLAILSISFAAIMSLYELVRRNNVLRFLFGMKTLPAGPAAQAVEPAPAN